MKAPADGLRKRTKARGDSGRHNLIANGEQRVHALGDVDVCWFRTVHRAGCSTAAVDFQDSLTRGQMLLGFLVVRQLKGKRC